MLPLQDSYGVEEGAEEQGPAGNQSRTPCVRGYDPRGPLPALLTDD